VQFGPFEIDERTWTLTRDRAPVDLSPRLVELLGFLAMRSGVIVTKDELLAKFWPDVNISENTLTRAIADIRKAIGDNADEPQYVLTLARRGYKFIGQPLPVSRLPVPDEDPFQAWVKGRLALETLDLTRLTEAVGAFERAVISLPSYAPAFAGLANAYLLQFERTRSGSLPDRALLARAIETARKACAIDPSIGEGWATLGYLLAAAGKHEDAQAAARRGTALEPDNWRHQFRLAHTTWGEERLRAVERTLALFPGFAPARMLSAMVFVARGAVDRAEKETRLGAESQRSHRGDQTPLPAAGLHWLHGLVLLSRGDTGAAARSFEEEIATGDGGHVYAREFALNARVAMGFMKLNAGDVDGAGTAFQSALDQAAGHPRATVGLFAAGGSDGSATEGVIADLIRGERATEAALVSACVRRVGGQPDQAIAVLDQLLTNAPPGPAGWIIPVDPMLSTLHDAAKWPMLLEKLAARAA
jgi:DNA-binding winged helix-turn-helix (wHTH) protein/cytochrome c-type biogenesis protein CcmH/NrfG